MKLPDNLLHLLIKDLTIREQEQLSVSADQQSAYWQLYLCIKEQAQYDEAALKSVNAPFAKHLAENKQYLLEWLLDRLSQWRQPDESSERQTKRLQAQELLHRGFATAATSRLTRMVKDQIQKKAWHDAIQTIQLLKKSVDGSESKTAISLDTLLQYEAEILENLLLHNKLLQLNRTAAEYQRRFQQSPDAETRAKLQSILSNHLLQEAPPQDFQAALLFWQTLAVTHFTLNNRIDAAQANQQSLRLFETHPNQQHQDPTRYLSIWQNYLIDLLQMGDFETLPHEIQRLRQLALEPAFRNNPRLQARIFRQTGQLELNQYLSVHRFDLAANILPELRAGLKLHSTHLSRTEILTFNYLEAYVYWGNGQWSNTISALQPILQDAREDVVLEIFHYARMLALISHYELGHHQLLDSLLPATRRYWTKQNSLTPIHRLVLEFIRKSIQLPKPLPKSTLLPDLQVPSSAHQRIFQYVDLLRWAQNKCQ